MSFDLKKNVWGLTGGIASGKSAAARFFSESGIPVIDADQISRELSSAGGRAHAPILKRFGTDDRTKLRQIVFSDAQARKDLEAILHPLIRAESLARMQKIGRGPIVYEAALLIEGGRAQDFAGLIVVDSSRDRRRERLIQRDGCTPEMADRILASQTDDERRREAATLVLENDGTLDELRSKVQELAKRLHSAKN